MKSKKARNIGKDIKSPRKKCDDPKCPFHGELRVRSRTLQGTVIGANMLKTATVEWGRKVLIPKYERYTKKRTRVKARNPECIKAEKGDIVKLKQCRPLSKTVHFVIVEKLGKEKGFLQKMESLEESKVPEKEEKEENESS